MPKSVFVVGIGGTGMRCIESFVHLCAIGMFDDTEVHLLAMDTDKDNGNFRRLAYLVDNYRKINGNAMKKHTLFSAKINYYQFSPDYDKSESSSMSKIINNRYNNEEICSLGADSKIKASELVNLLLRPEVVDMDLKHGYRAQTQMGSMLMYYAIIERAYQDDYNKTTSGLRGFMNALNDGNSGHYVFVFGSVFGGTGASSLPIIPPAFNSAAKILSRNNCDVIEGNYYGSVILTNYFAFDSNVRTNDKVYATSDKFALNSQAALNYYLKDQTVNDVYKRLYVLGREESLQLNGPVVTGGAEQSNPADYIELMAAFAAYDFFKTAPEDFKKDDLNKKFYCKGLPMGVDHLSFNNFTEDADEFRKRLGAMTVTAFLNSAYSYFENIRRDTITFDEKLLEPLYNYFRTFGLYNDNGTIKSGWLEQIFNSAIQDNYQNGAFFMKPLFECLDEKRLKKYEINSKLFNMETPKSFKVGLFSSPFNVIKDNLKNYNVDNDNSLDALLERTYHTIVSLYSL